jgi:hypothetical protein
MTVATVVLVSSSLLQGWIYPDPAHARSGFFLPSFSHGSALDQVQKITINQSVKKAFAGLST